MSLTPTPAISLRYNLCIEYGWLFCREKREEAGIFILNNFSIVSQKCIVSLMIFFSSTSICLQFLLLPGLEEAIKSKSSSRLCVKPALLASRDCLRVFKTRTSVLLETKLCLLLVIVNFFIYNSSSGIVEIHLSLKKLRSFWKSSESVFSIILKYRFPIVLNSGNSAIFSLYRGSDSHSLTSKTYSVSLLFSSMKP